MSDDIEYRKAWARANVGRSALSGYTPNHRLTIKAELKDNGSLDTNCSCCPSCPGFTFALFESVSFTDGLPAIIPRLVNGEWTWDGKDEAAKLKVFGADPVPLPPEKAKKAKKLIGDLRDRTLGTPPPDPLQIAALRTLHFLADLVPLPGWAPSTERELMACARELKAALKGGRE